MVEDDSGIREAVQLVLEDEGFEVVTATNGAEAVVELEHCEPCVMLLDLAMPVMSGWELLERLGRDGRLPDGIRVIVVSATPRDVPPGIAAILRKPVRVEELIATIRHYC